MARIGVYRRRPRIFFLLLLHVPSPFPPPFRYSPSGVKCVTSTQSVTVTLGLSSVDSGELLALSHAVPNAYHHGLSKVERQ